MNDKILQKYGGRNGDPVAGSPALDEADVADDLAAFGWLRGVRERAEMLELRKKTGAIRAIPYGWIEAVDFDPSEGITIHVAGQKISIKGRNLNAETWPGVRLFQGLTRHKVPWIQEADEPTLIKAEKNITVVEALEW